MMVSQPRTVVSHRSAWTKLTASSSPFNAIRVAASTMQPAERTTKERVQNNHSLGWAQVKSRSGSNSLIRQESSPCQDTRRRRDREPSAPRNRV